QLPQHLWLLERQLDEFGLMKSAGNLQGAEAPPPNLGRHRVGGQEDSHVFTRQMRQESFPSDREPGSSRRGAGRLPLPKHLRQKEDAAAAPVPNAEEVGAKRHREQDPDSPMGQVGPPLKFAMKGAKGPTVEGGAGGATGKSTPKGQGKHQDSGGPPEPSHLATPFSRFSTKGMPGKHASQDSGHHDEGGRMTGKGKGKEQAPVGSDRGKGQAQPDSSAGSWSQKSAGKGAAAAEAKTPPPPAMVKAQILAPPPSLQKSASACTAGTTGKAGSVGPPQGLLAKAPAMPVMAEVGQAKRKIAEVQEDVYQEEELPYSLIDKLQDAGINAADLKKLKDAGYNTSQSVVFAMRKDLLNIKGLSDQKVDKIIEAARKSSEAGFVTCTQLLSKMKNRFQISTGAAKLDQMLLAINLYITRSPLWKNAPAVPFTRPYRLGGGMESCSITELFGEFRCGKTQVCHSLSVMAQLPPNMGGANGKVVYIDTEGTFRPERIRQIAEGKGVSAEAAMNNIVYARCYTSDHLEQLLLEAASLMVNDEDRFALLIVDSIMGGFRVDYSGRGELADRQQKLARVMSKLQKVSEEFNVAVVLTNQVMADPGGGCAFMPSHPKPVGGHILAHFSTTRIMLRKGRAEQRIAKIYDSPCLPESESVFEIFAGGVRPA
ncbi:DMC1A, partial [Symbiodinium necroappetens]